MMKVHQGSGMLKSILGHSINVKVKVEANGSKQGHWTWVEISVAKSLQSCPILWDPIDGSPPGSPVPGILQARTLEWVAISFSSTWKWKLKVKLLSRVRLFTIPWTAAYQAPLPMGFSRQEYWSGVPLPSPLSAALDINFQILLLSTFLFFFLPVWLLLFFF